MQRRASARQDATDGSVLSYPVERSQHRGRGDRPTRSWHRRSSIRVVTERAEVTAGAHDSAVTTRTANQGEETMAHPRTAVGKRHIPLSRAKSRSARLAGATLVAIVASVAMAIP